MPTKGGKVSKIKKCGTCPQYFLKSRTLALHRRGCHAFSVNRPCVRCKKPFCDKKEFDNHREQCARTCKNSCGVVFVSADNALRHENSQSCVPRNSQRILEIETPETPSLNIPEPETAPQGSASNTSWNLSVESPADAGDAGDKDAQAVAMYVDEIFGYMSALETRFAIPEGYVQNTENLTNRRRAVLIDWIIRLHQQFELAEETLHLAVAIFDRFLSCALATPEDQFQLVGITSLLLAAKYEDHFLTCPSINELLFSTRYQYYQRQLEDMELEILRALHFDLGSPNSLIFLRRFSKAVKASDDVKNVATYFLELMLLRHEMYHTAPSLQAAAALCLSIYLDIDEKPVILKNVWSSTLHILSGYALPQVAEALRTLATLVTKGHISALMSVKKKFPRASQCVDSKLEQLRALQN